MTAPTPADGLRRRLHEVWTPHAEQDCGCGTACPDKRCRTCHQIERDLLAWCQREITAAQAAPRAADAAAPDWVEGTGTCPCGHPVTQHDATVAHPCRRVGCPCGAPGAEAGVDDARVERAAKAYALARGWTEAEWDRFGSTQQEAGMREGIRAALLAAAGEEGGR